MTEKRKWWLGNVLLLAVSVVALLALGAPGARYTHQTGSAAPATSADPCPYSVNMDMAIQTKLHDVGLTTRPDDFAGQEQRIAALRAWAALIPDRCIREGYLSNLRWYHDQAKKWEAEKDAIRGLPDPPMVQTTPRG